MESQRLPLDQLIAKYERGNQLLKTCQQRIEQAENRIELIAKGESGVHLQPFDPATATEEPATQQKPEKSSGPASPAPKEAESEPSDEIQLF
jgi:exodeoxyribonuclease VII small subunit